MKSIFELTILIILNNLFIVLIGLLIHNQMVELKPLQVLTNNKDNDWRRISILKEYLGKRTK